VDVLCPVGLAGAGPASASRLATRLATLDRARIGFVDNGWAALDTVFAGVRDVLRARHDAECEVKVESHERIPEHASSRLATLVDGCVVGLGN
jgi:hypothetical protein